jgi:hypothetical protein
MSMTQNDDQNKAENPPKLTDEELYEVFGENDDEIILQIIKRQDENRALKKLLENLNSTIKKTKYKKKSNY